MKITDIITEAANPAQQAAIAVAMKKAGKKPKSEGMAEGSLEEIDRRGFLKGAGAAAVAGASGIGYDQYTKRGLWPKDLDKEDADNIWILIILYIVSRVVSNPPQVNRRLQNSNSMILML
jgi:hypothetical protein